MKYLLGTNILVDHLRGKKPIKVDYLKKGGAISCITQAELYYGAYKSKNFRENLSKIKAMLAELAIEVLVLNEEIAQLYGRLKADLEKKGRKLDEFDLLIASTAISFNLILVTGNKKHFQRIPQLQLRE